MQAAVHAPSVLHGCAAYPCCLQVLLPQHDMLGRRLAWGFWATNWLVLGDVFLTAYVDPLISDNKSLQVLIAM